MRTLLRFLGAFVLLFALIVLLALVVAAREKPNTIEYGVSFNTLYARELGLDPSTVFKAILDELDVEKLRLAAHWNMVEPTPDTFSFVELDEQLQLAKEHDAEVILAIGRRLPRWPECHTPAWAKELSWDEQKEEIRRYLREVVNRYKDEEHITHWQVENEPFLTVFASEHCGDSLDKRFLEEEIALVKELDSEKKRPVLLTDSGNLGLWYGAYKRGDAFGTSVYVYLWNPELGPFKSQLPPLWYRSKWGLMEMVYGEKETMLIELSLEPWLTSPVTEVAIETQLSRMNIEKVNEILQFAQETRLEKQYLWGAEWWYWMREREHPEFWDRAKEVFAVE